MTPQRNTPSCLARFGALGLAAATVVTGLTLSPTAPAVAQPAPSATQEAPAEAPASPAASTPVDVSSSTPVEVTDEADLAAPTITRSTSYTDAAGQTVYRYEGTGVAGATVQHGPSRASWQDGPTVGTDGTFVLETTRIPVGEQKMELRQKLDTQASAKIEVAISDMVAELPRVAVTKSTSYTNAAGQTVYRYEGTGVAGATVQHGPSRASWQDGPTVGSDGTFVLETTRIPVGEQKMELRQKLDTQASAKIEVAIADMVAELPRVAVTKSTSYTNAAGQTVYRYEGTGVAGATVQHGPSRASWQDGPTVGTDGTFILETTRIPVGDQKMELRQKLDTQASAKIEVAIADMVAELPVPSPTSRAPRRSTPTAAGPTGTPARASPAPPSRSASAAATGPPRRPPSSTAPSPSRHGSPPPNRPRCRCGSSSPAWSPPESSPRCPSRRTSPCPS